MRHAPQFILAATVALTATGCDLFRSVDSSVRVEPMPQEMGAADMATRDMPDDTAPRSDAEMDAAADAAIAGDAAADDSGPWRFENTLSQRRSTRGLVMLYTFTEGLGASVPDRSGVSPRADLAITGTTTWGSQGLTIAGARLSTPAAPSKFYDAIIERETFTVELWATTDDLELSGPARLVSWSQDSGSRNFTVGVEGSALVVRLRTSSRHAANELNNGLPSLVIEGVIDLSAKHLVVTYDGVALRVYVDGVLRATAPRLGGLAGWSRDYRMIVGNEFSDDRAWTGTMHLIAAYDRALSLDEIRAHLQVGPRP